MKLTIDTREKPTNFVRVLRKIVGEDNTEVVKLDCADYAWGTALGIERKRVGNLVSSMVAQRKDTTELWDQLNRCLATYGRVILLVEGSLEATTEIKACLADGRRREVPYVSVQATLLKAQEKGVQILWTGSVHETALVLKWLHGLVQRREFLSRSIPMGTGLDTTTGISY